jgi:PAS domain S-box-containing protein
MMNFFRNLFDGTEFMPHGHCYFWKPEIVWLHVLSDSLIALAYYSIPITLVYFVRKRRDVPFPWMFLMFGAFIVACGTTHLMEVWTLWIPAYRLSGAIKIITGILSIGTAILLVPLTPKALALPSPSELEAANLDLQKQIVERKRAVEALRESEERFRGAFDFAAVGMALVGLDGRWLQVNRSLCELVGYSEEELLNTNFQSITHPEDLETALAYMRQVLSGEIPQYQMEKRYFHKFGHIVWILLSVSLVRDAQGAPLYFISQIQDISQRRQAEQQLRQAEEKYRNLFENAVEGVFQTTPDGRYLSANPALSRMYGFESPQELVASLTNFDQETYVDPTHRANFRSLLQENGVLKEFEAQIYRKDGRKIWTSTNAQTVLDVRGQPVAYQGCVQDITERKEAEERLKHSGEQLRALWIRLQSVREEERTRIAREIHDELGQALTSLKMDLSWLEKKIALPGDENSKAPLLDKVQAMSSFMGTTLDKVRKIAAELRPAVLDDLGLTAALEWQAREFEARTGIECNSRIEEMKLDPSLSTTVFRIFQEAMTNIVRHARATEVQVVFGKSAKKLLLVVRDNGRGVTDEEIADPRSLGILGARERAALLGGRIRIRGTPGKGTSVILRVPLKKLSSGTMTVDLPMLVSANTA